jgi:hypothetical protein
MKTSMKRTMEMRMTWTLRGNQITGRIMTAKIMGRTQEGSLRGKGDQEVTQGLTGRCLPTRGREDLRKTEKVPGRAENARKITYLV